MASPIVNNLNNQNVGATEGKIFDIKVMPNGKVYVRVVDNNGQLIGDDLVRYVDKEKESKATVDIKTIKNVKIIKAPNTGKSAPAILITNNSLNLIAEDGKKGVSVIKDVGTFINGEVTFDAHPESIKLWNVYRMNGDLTSTMPSTIITPIPILKLDLPVNSIKALKEILEEIKSLLL